MKHRISPQSGAAFTLDKGQYLRVTDPHGEQVSDLVCFNRHDTREWLSSGKTLDYASTLLITRDMLCIATGATSCWIRS